MPIVSIITPLFAPTAFYLRDTIASVSAQQLPSGWHVEWLVQEDGSAPTLADQFRQVSFARYESNGAQLGVAATRNLALSRVTGDLVQVLDHDDVLLPCALAALIPKFGTRSIHWAIGQADDLMPDGRRVSWDSALPFGLVPRGTVNTLAIEREGNWPIHCAGLMLRTDSVRALGGWAATPSDDDVVMFSALAELTEGYNEPTVTWLYRQHQDQAHRLPTWRHRSEQCRRVALQRIMAIRHAGLTLSHTAPITVSNRSNSAAIRVGPPEKES